MVQKFYSFFFRTKSERVDRENLGTKADTFISTSSDVRKQDINEKIKIGWTAVFKHTAIMFSAKIKFRFPTRPAQGSSVCCLYKAITCSYEYGAGMPVYFSVYLLAHIPSLGGILITIHYIAMIKRVSALDIKDTNQNIKSKLIYNFNLYINLCYFLGTFCFFLCWWVVGVDLKNYTRGVRYNSINTGLKDGILLTDELQSVSLKAGI
jgi:hypothetical protein